MNTNNINKRAKLIESLCRKENKKDSDYSIYKNYVTRLYCFGAMDKFNESILGIDFNFIISPRFKEHCLDKRKKSQGITIHNKIIDSFLAREILEREKNE